MAMLRPDQIEGRTKALFVETSEIPEYVQFTLKHEDGEYPSLKKIFLELVVDDPTEYNFAVAVFGDVTYWNKLQSSPALRVHFEEWRATCDVKRKSIAFQALTSEVREGGRGALQAAKYLIEEPWKPKARSAKAKEAASKTSSQARELVRDDIERLRDYLN